MAKGRPYQAYQQTGVQTSNQKQLIIMLYDGMNRYMSQAIKAIDEQDFEAAHLNLTSTGKVLLELLGTLREDRGGIVAENLKKLYVYSYQQIVMANLKKDKQLVLEVQSLMSEIGEGWKQISKANAGTAGTGQPQARYRISG